MNDKRQYYIAKKMQINDQKALNQISMFQNIKHPNIVRMEQYFIQNNHLFIIEQYCEEGDLSFHIRRQIRKKKTLFRQQVLANWLLQILLAIEYLHNKKIVHRNIHPKNIFLTASGNIKLGSFKLSKTLANQLCYSSTIIKTPYYIAPQLLDNHGYDEKIDIWAFGCVLYQLCCLKSLFKSQNLIEVTNQFQKNKLYDLPSVYSKQLNMIFLRSMKKKSHERASAKDLLKNQYFLDSIKKFIQFRGLCFDSGKIPIKKYKIHGFKSHVRTPSLRKSREKIHSSKESKSQRCQKKNSQKKVKSVQKYGIFHTSKTKPSSKGLQQKKMIKDNRVCIIKAAKIPNNFYKNLAIPQKPPTPYENKVKQKLSLQNPSSRIEPLMAPPTLLLSQKQQINRYQNKYKQQQTELDDGNKRLSDIFAQLQIEQQEQISFQQQFQEENEFRLTFKKNEGQQLINTYNDKFGELIKQINYKYCPMMEAIQQKTSQFDSNEFAKFRNK